MVDLNHLPQMVFNPDLPPMPSYTAEEKAAQIEAGKALFAKIDEAYRNGEKVYTIAPGEYRFPDNQSVYFRNYENFTIQAYGAEFWLDRPESMLLDNPSSVYIDDCVNFTLEGLSIDYDPLLYIQAKVNAFDWTGEKPWIDVTADDDYPWCDVGPGQLVLYKADGHIMAQDVLYIDGVEKVGDADGRRLMVYLGNGEKKDSFAIGNFNDGVAKHLGEKVVLRPGDYVTIPFRRGGAVQVHRCRESVFRDVNIYAAPGMGILECYCEHCTYEGVRIVRRPETNRLLVGTADTFHCLCDTVGPTIRGCEFSCNCDDFINLHGFFSVVLKKVAPKQYIISPMVGEKYEPGITMDFSDYNSMEDQGSAKVVSSVEVPEYRPDFVAMMAKMKVHPHGGLRPQLVTLDREVNAVPESMVDINSLNCRGFLIEGNYFHTSMGRALLLSGSKGGIVRNNLWSELDGGVCIFMESHYYMEGQFPRDIVLENNRFENILGYASRQIYPHKVEQGYISVCLIPPGQYLRTGIVKIHNIVLRNNYIENPPFVPISCVYAENVEIKDNVVKNPYFLWDSADYRDEPNFYGVQPEGLVLASTCEDLRVSGNKALDENGNEIAWKQLTHLHTKKVVEK